jgi:CBS domain-containing protein
MNTYREPAGTAPTTVPAKPARLRRTLVRDVMSTNVISVEPDTPFAEVADLLWTKAIRAVPVLDAEDRLVGVVSGHDLMKTTGLGDPRRPMPPLASRWHRGGGAWHRPKTVFTMMSTEPVTVSPDASVAQAARTMYERHLGWLPVVDPDNPQKVVGVIVRSDLLSVFFRDDEDLREEILEGLPALGLTDPAQVHVEVDKGVVKLSGNVPSRREARLATEFVERIEGVVSLMHSLTYDVDDRRGDPTMGPLY